MNISLLQLAPLTQGGMSEAQGGLFDLIELISPDSSASNSLMHLAQLSQKIPYEVLVGLDKSIKRIII